MARVTKNKAADCRCGAAGHVVPITSAHESKDEFEELKKQNEMLRAELNRKEQEIIKLRILYAQMQTDMTGVQKKYTQLEQKYKSAIEANTVLLARCSVLEAELLQLRRIEYGSTSERMETAGHNEMNTTALPEGTSTGEADENNMEARMAEEGSASGGEANQEENPASEEGTPPEEPSGNEDRAESQGQSNSGEKVSRPNGIRKQMKEKLPSVKAYPLSPELIRKLDELYGKDKWKFKIWEPTAHLVHIPEMYINQIDYVPVITDEEGNLIRPYAEHPDAFPVSILPHSIVSSSEFANIIHKKFVLGIPLYSQEREMLEMQGIHLGRQSMGDWVIDAGTKGFVQVYEYLIRMEQVCAYHSIDETFLQVLRDGRAAATKSYLWAHRTGELADPVHPVAVFMFELTRATEHLRKYFPDDIAAIISCDHYISYEVLEKEREKIFTALCWMHVRRRFFFAFDLVANIQGLSEQAVRETLEAKLLQKIGEIYREEMKLQKLTPNERKTGRDQKVRPLVEAFFAMLHAMDLEDAGLTSTLKDAVHYALGGEEKLKRFLDDPRIPIDNGSAERIIRRIAKGRRAWLFCDTEDGAKALAVMYSLVTTAQLNEANDYYYIKYLCEHIPGGISNPLRELTDEELEALMPWSEQYKAYEKHEIESRYDGITITGSITHKPEIDDVQKMRLKMETQVAASDKDSNEADNPSALPASVNAELPANEKRKSLSDGNTPVESNDAIDYYPDPTEEENSMVEVTCTGNEHSQTPGGLTTPVLSEICLENPSPGPWPDAAERKTG